MSRVKFYLTAILLSYLTESLHAVVQSSSNEINSYLNRFNYDYCEPGLCASNKRHIACGNKGRFGHSCTSDARVVEFDDYHKRLILYMHNVHRNQIALGQTPGFSQAARMGALQWDDELAYLAELNAMSCEIEHDKCRNTRTYHFAGQNLAMGWLLEDHTLDWAIRNFTTEWFIEYKDTPQDVIDRFYRPGGPAIGHFTLMVNDKQSKVGCGLVKFTKRLNNYNYKVHVLACNYSWTNVFTFPVYRRGATASGCLTGKHYYYSGLCSDAEQIKELFIMPYVASDGRILDKPPFTTRVILFFTGFWQFIVYFFKTLFGENVNKSGSNYSRDYRGGYGGGGPGSGPGGNGPRPPQRRIGRIGRMSDVSCPPMGG